jgi:hypothetical protein
MTFTEENHIVNILPPVDITGAATSSDVFTLKNYGHATIIVEFGVVNDAADATLTLAECDDFTPSNSTNIAFKYRLEDTATGDTLGPLSTAPSTGLRIVSGGDIGITDNKFLVIEVDATELSSGYPALELSITNPGNSVLASAQAILSQPRYEDKNDPTAIA